MDARSYDLRERVAGDAVFERRWWWSGEGVGMVRGSEEVKVRERERGQHSETERMSDS